MLRHRMHAGNGERAKEAVGVVHHVDIETAVIDAAAEEGAGGVREIGGVGIDGDDTAAVLQHLRELFGGIPRRLEEQALVHSREQIRGAEGEGQADGASGGEGKFAKFGAGEKGEDGGDEDSQAEKQERGDAGGPVVEDEKTDEEAAQR